MSYGMKKRTCKVCGIVFLATAEKMLNWQELQHMRYKHNEEFEILEEAKKNVSKTAK